MFREEERDFHRYLTHWQDRRLEDGALDLQCGFIFLSGYPSPSPSSIRPEGQVSQCSRYHTPSLYMWMTALLGLHMEGQLHYAGLAQQPHF